MRLFLLYIVCVLVCGTLGLDEQPDIQGGQGQVLSGECSVLIENIQNLQAAFPCVQDYVSSCGGKEPIIEKTTTPLPTTGPVNVGTYIPNWFVYRKFYMGVEKMGVLGDQPQNPDDADQQYVFWATSMDSFASKFTHLYYAFWKLDENCYVQDGDPDASWYGAKNEPTWIKPVAGACKGLMNDMMALKSKYPHLKLLLSVGGWTYSKNFSKCASTSDGISTFYKTVAYRLNEMDSNWGKTNAIWNGIDFDWEFPESAGGLYPDHSNTDYNNYVTLIKYFRSTASSEGRNAVVLSIASAVGETLDRLASKPSVAKALCDALDHVNVMTYDIHGKWDPTTGHNAQFCWDSRPGNPSMRKSVSGSIDTLIGAGCNPKKVIVGLPNYSHAWTLIAPGPLGNGLFVRASDDTKFVGWSTFSDSDKDLIPQGIISFWDMKDTLSLYPDFKVYSWNCPTLLGISVPIKHVYSSTRQAFANYDDEEVLSKKTAWARARGLGGFFFWDAQQDRNGVLLDAARNGWGGLPTHSASGSKQCFDSRKPKYANDPITREIDRNEFGPKIIY